MSFTYWITGCSRLIPIIIFQLGLPIMRVPDIEATINIALYDADKVSHNKKAHTIVRALCGLDGTRTRDLRRDRPAF